MKERPILFSAPMVLAILAGTKTQTRRIVKPQPKTFNYATDPPRPLGDGLKAIRCPYGQPGDRLWVREAWSTHKSFDHLPPRDCPRSIHYSADGQIDTGKGRPSIHLPRWASRIDLEITAVRVERLNDISEADALAEGAQHNGLCDHARRSCSEIGCWGPNSYRSGYCELWESINGPGSWAANPWVWGVEFRRAAR